jgi:low affinity Fe/Cu permease
MSAFPGHRKRIKKLIRSVKRGIAGQAATAIDVATLIVWTMTFIQRADRRDTLAVHAKLDELLKATRDARTELAVIKTSVEGWIATTSYRRLQTAHFAIRSLFIRRVATTPSADQS